MQANYFSLLKIGIKRQKILTKLWKLYYTKVSILEMKKLQVS